MTKHDEIWAKEETEIDGAKARLRDGALEYQPRYSDGDLLWDAWSRDRHYDGWTSERLWGASPEVFLSSRRVEPAFDPVPIGWSIEQITKAKVWAGDLIATRNVAEKFAPTREAAE